MLLVKENSRFRGLEIFLLSLVISAALLFVCSINSIFYPINGWTDVYIFFSVEDSMFHGNVLYKDIFEHKGPFLYLVIYGLAHFLGNSCFTIYLFECIANALFVYFSTQIILLYDKEASGLRVFLYALCLEFCLCTSAVFMFGGTLEELFLWTSAFGIYVTLRSLKHDQYYSDKELILIGVMCGVLFWSKYSLLGFYAGLALYVIIWNLAKKQFARLGKTTALFLSGFIITCIPTVIYCLITESFLDMINVYFIGNIFGTHVTTSFIARLYSLLTLMYKDVTIVLLILFGFLLLKIERTRGVKLLIITTFISTFLASCCLNTLILYYPIMLIAFISLGIVALREVKIGIVFKIAIVSFLITLHLFASLEFSMYSLTIGNNINLDWAKEYMRVFVKAIIPLLILMVAWSTKKTDTFGMMTCIECGCFLLMTVLLGYYVRDSFYFTIKSFPQYQFAETIKQIDNANILVYKSIDHGFFRPANTYPQVKYFCTLNLIPDDMEIEQLAYIHNEVVDFIISSKELDDEIIGTSYKLIDVSGIYYFVGNNTQFYLYGK